MTLIRRHLVITGRVQGVFYRATCRRVAEKYGVAGWVRNNADGSVEAVFEGPADAVEAVCDWCRDGPPYAEVEHIRVADEEVRHDAGFEIR